MMVTGVVSGTEWDNFLTLRMDSGAQSDINQLATQINDLLFNEEPNTLDWYDWHIPIIDGRLQTTTRTVEQIARASYGNLRVDSKRPEGVLYEELADSGHWSPFEHVATTSPNGDGQSNFHCSWVQLRQLKEEGVI